MDFLPTFLDLAEADYPQKIRNHPVLPLHGRSLLPIFSGEKASLYKHLFFSFSNARAVIAGDWKLVRDRAKQSPWELYNLSTDPTELHNLASEQPDRVSALAAKIAKWEKDGTAYQD